MVGALYDLHLAGGAAAAAPPHVEVMLPLVCTDREVARNPSLSPLSLSLSLSKR